VYSGKISLFVGQFVCPCVCNCKMSMLMRDREGMEREREREGYHNYYEEFRG
jgi:hypothetical protein